VSIQRRMYYFMCPRRVLVKWCVCGVRMRGLREGSVDPGRKGQREAVEVARHELYTFKI
jgi:hypothetical protein